MQCPNCKLTIKDDAKMCMHCGMTFQSPIANPQGNVYQQPIQQQPMVQQANPLLQPQQQVAPTPNQQQEQTRQRYLDAFMHGKYQQIATMKFSWATFFLGIFWFLLKRMYKEAIIWQLRLFLVSLIAGVINSLLHAIGIRFSLATPCAGVVNLYLLFLYCTQYSSIYLTHANKKIDKIIANTPDEEARIKKCKKAGSINLFILLIPVLLIAALFFVVYKSYQSTLSLYEEAYQESLKKNIRTKYSTIVEDISKNKLKPKDSSEFQNGKYYYYVYPSETQHQYGSRQSNIFMSSYTTQGYAVIYYEEGIFPSTTLQTNKDYVVYICLSSPEMKQRAEIDYGAYKNKITLNNSDSNVCSFKDDIPKEYNAIELEKTN